MFLESERLYLREIVPLDFDILYELDTDLEVIKYIFSPRTREQSEERMEFAIKNYDLDNGLGKWLAVEKDTGNVIGWYMLLPFQDTDWVEIGYRLRKEYWGKGYATEMSKVLLDYGLNTLNLKTIVGLTHKDHDLSGKVLTKIGLEHKGLRRYYDMDVQFYEVSN